MSGFGHVRGSYCLDDGAKWAAEFKRVVLDRNIKVDEGLMLGWFCNAIEIAHDHRMEPKDTLTMATRTYRNSVGLCQTLETYAERDRFFSNRNPDDWERII
jgi:hypothetical protein